MRLLAALVSTTAVTAVSAIVVGQSGLDQLPGEIRVLVMSDRNLVAPGEPYEVFVKPPAALPVEVIPADAVFAGAVVSKSATTAVVRLTGIDLAQVPYLWQLAEAGWVTYSTPFGLAMPSEQWRLPLCRGTQFLSVIHDPATRLMRMTLSNKQPGQCARALRGNGLLEFPAPMIRLPAGVRFKSGQGGGTSDERYHNTAVDGTDMSPQSMAKSILPQLLAAGWRIEAGPTADDAMSTARLTAKCRDGQPATAVLTVTALTGTSTLDVMLRIVRSPR